MCGVCVYMTFLYSELKKSVFLLFLPHSVVTESLGDFSVLIYIYIGSHVYYIIFYKKKFADENKELDKLDLKMGIVLGCRVCVVVVDEKQLQL